MKALVMGFAPAAAALSLVFVTTASVSVASERIPDPRSVMLQESGRAALVGGDTQGAIDAFESALAVDPGHTAVFLDLAEAARQVGLQGKAITYYREALARNPRNFAAMSGEGEALVERGAVEKAKRKLAELETMCGETCPETEALRSTISTGPTARLAAETNDDTAAAN
jgi:Tfp pilus assembly protein PilF